MLHPVRRLTILLLLTATALPAQGTELRPGVRVRFDAPGVVAPGFVGTIISSTPDSLVVATREGTQVRVPTRALTRLEVSRGESRSLGAGKGALWGVGILGGGGVIVAMTARKHVVEDFGQSRHDERLDGDEQLAVAAAFAGAGAFYGAIIGAIVGAERWEHFDTSTRVGLVPTRHGVRLALSWRP